MIVTEYEGVDEYVDLHCDRCGFRKRLFNASTMDTFKVRCACHKARPASEVKKEGEEQ